MSRPALAQPPEEEVLPSDRLLLAAGAAVPQPPTSPRALVAKSEGANVFTRLGASLFLVSVCGGVIAANMHVIRLVERHDSGGGVIGWLSFAALDALFCLAFVAVVWLPARWTLRRIGNSVVLVMLTLLSATCLIAMVPTLGWNAVDAANLLWDSAAPRQVTVEVVDQTSRGKTGPFSVIQETGEPGATTVAPWTLGLSPIGSRHELRRGSGFFGRPYYLRPR